MLTKTVLLPAEGGGCKLADVPFSWQHGDPLPERATQYVFPTALEALIAMADRGRLQNAAHVPNPRKSAVAEETRRVAAEWAALLP